MTIEERLDVIENDIVELKEAFQTLSTAAPAVASNESLLKTLQEQVAALTTAQQNCRTQCDELKVQVGSLTDRTSSLEEQSTINTTTITTINSSLADKLDPDVFRFDGSTLAIKLD